jgi:predicted metal-binding membrane protein
MDTSNGRTDFEDSQKPPVKAGWICLIVAWALFLIPIPGLGIIGWVLNLAAFIISIIVMVKGRVAAGVAQMVCVFTVSPVMYFIGLGILGHILWPRPRFYRTWV